MPLLLGVRAKWLLWQPGSKPEILKHSLYGDKSHVEDVLSQCLLGMPLSLAQLLGKEPWSSYTHKVGVFTRLDSHSDAIPMMMHIWLS